MLTAEEMIATAVMKPTFLGRLSKTETVQSFWPCSSKGKPVVTKHTIYSDIKFSATANQQYQKPRVSVQYFAKPIKELICQKP